MDYEKKYNEILAWAKKYKARLNGVPIEDIFPELRESEDDEIYREIYSIVHHHYERSAGLLVSPRDRNEMLEKWEKAKSFLEKQKEQKPNFDTHWENGSMVCEQKEHKPNIELIQRSWYMEGYHDRDFGKEPKWIMKTGKGGPKYELNPKYGQPLAKEQKPAEWSEEDEKMRDNIICILQKYVTRTLPTRPNSCTYSGNAFYTHQTEIDWLKSIRPSWKPSEEHLSALLAVFNDPNNIGSQTCQLALNDLYEQLKKL